MMHPGSREGVVERGVDQEVRFDFASESVVDNWLWDGYATTMMLPSDHPLGHHLRLSSFWSLKKGGVVTLQLWSVAEQLLGGGGTHLSVRGRDVDSGGDAGVMELLICCS